MEEYRHWGWHEVPSELYWGTSGMRWFRVMEMVVATGVMSRIQATRVDSAKGRKFKMLESVCHGFTDWVRKTPTGGINR